MSTHDVVDRPSSMFPALSKLFGSLSPGSRKLGSHRVTHGYYDRISFEEYEPIIRTER